MRVVLSDRAKADLRDIAFYIARDSPKRARFFVRELRQKAMEIGDNPSVFPIFERYKDREIRRRVYGNYLIFYSVIRSTIMILYIVHGAMDDMSDPFSL
jgi:plasmid stabilization system protein ParE